MRGDVRVRVPIAALVDPSVDGDDLTCTIEGEPVRFSLGASRARAWIAAIAAPPPSLAKKLGISETTRLSVIGDLDDDALLDAVSVAAHRSDVDSLSEADLAVVRTDDAACIAALLARVVSIPTPPPLWIVYRKGRGAPLGESRVRAVMREGGWIDTKVAAVSTLLTALRFDYRRTPR